MQDVTIHLGLGSNLGDREANLRNGLADLQKAGLRLRDASSLYLTEPDLGGAGPDEAHPWYINCVAAFDTGLAPGELLAVCLKVESRHGRERGAASAVASGPSESLDDAARPGERRRERAAVTGAPSANLDSRRPVGEVAGVGVADPQPRTLDIDILLYADISLSEAGLRIPHPRLHRRRFVLQPLAEIAPALVVPGVDLSVRDLLAGLPPTPRAVVLRSAPREVA